MIPIGTVCYLTGDHSRAGQCCTVTGPLEFIPADDNDTGRDVWCYEIELASGEEARATPGDDGGFYDAWNALPHNLIPITPPGLTTDEDKRIPVAA